MSVGVVIQFAVASAIIIGGCTVYAMFTRSRKRPSRANADLERTNEQRQNTAAAVNEHSSHIYIREAACPEILEAIPHTAQGLIPAPTLSNSQTPIAGRRGDGGYIRL